MLDNDQIEAAALKLYDKFNPNWKFEINVSKAECIRLAAAGRPARRWRRLHPPTVQRDAIVEGRKIIRAAFDIVRNDPAEVAVKSNLLDALTGKVAITETLLVTARQIIDGAPGEGATK